MPLTEEQLAVRKSGIGASEAPVVCGFSRFRTKVDVFLDKRGIYKAPSTAFMDWGHALEPVLADQYAREHGVTLQRCNRTLRHPRYSWVLATPDRFIVEGPRRKGTCEIKSTTYFSDDWAEDGADAKDNVPLDYYAQCQWQLEVVGLDEGVLVAGAVASRDLRHYPFVRDQPLIDEMLAEVDFFWHEHVLTGIPPELDGGDATKAWLAHAYPKSGQALVEAPLAAAAWARQYLEGKAAEDAGKQKKDEAAAYLKASIGENAGIKGPWGSATWKQTKSNGVDWERAARELAAELRAAHQWRLALTTDPEARAVLEQKIAKADDAALAKEFAAPGIRRFALKPADER